MTTPTSPTHSFRYCPGCGGQNGTSPSLKHFACPDCGFTFYSNAAAAVAAFLVNAKGEFLWVRRAREPQKGKWNVPGGFVDPGESAAEALFRETLEEVGLKITSLDWLASYPNLYTYRSVTYHTLDFFYLCRAETLTTTLERTEIEEIKWLLPEAVNPDEIAFSSTKQALQTYLARKEEIGFPKEK